MTTIACSECRATLRQRGTRFLVTMALAFAAGVVLGVMLGQLA